jgi:hypothetical protein
MTILFAALQNSVLTIESSNNGDWKTRELLKGYNPTSLSVDTQSVFCGTWNKGAYKSDDSGQTWNKIDAAFLNNKNITSISSSPFKGKNEPCKLVVGTEPSCLFISNDGEGQWDEINNFLNLESSSNWSFPPRPWTHHVRWIEPDKNKEDYLFVAIEAGALIQSHDGGKTWIDRVDKGPYDTHTLLTHTIAPARLYSAAGDGYFESQDYGETWQKPMNGLEHTYVAGMAINPDDPNNINVSVASGAWKAHFFDANPESFLYRRLKDEEKWELVTKGLPQAEGTIISNLAANPKVKEEFYCLNNRGIFNSVDAGLSWSQLNLEWPKEYLVQHPRALAVSE